MRLCSFATSVSQACLLTSATKEKPTQIAWAIFLLVGKTGFFMEDNSFILFQKSYFKTHIQPDFPPNHIVSYHCGVLKNDVWGTIWGTSNLYKDFSKLVYKSLHTFSQLETIIKQ
jgi:hypothetical protein